MKGQNKSSTSSCNIHPVDFVEGVCPLCLNERLLVLATLQSLRPKSPSVSYQTKQEPKVILQDPPRKKPIRVSSLFSFFELRHHYDQKTDHQNTSIISPEDSFISINFEDNQATSWDKGKEHCKASCNYQYQHVMLDKKKMEIVPQPMPRSQLTWRKRIRRLLRVISFKNRSRACHLSAKVEDEDDLRRSWLRPLSPTTNKTPPI
ncbi:hypothetical protein CARUB_v10010841mg [Capsella rubella]|uniref:Uncharacterized protein n=1 Tax=Capsella rubella TaxID=81985 RepID=R0I2C9_9BRAS|nr:uncharacterized protein LOC17898506 [Capsella rubella]EOA36399.1 hypothetical protein CARUB_v10010841mg [Capsella rubella]